MRISRKKFRTFFAIFVSRPTQKTKPCFVTLRTFFSSTAGQGFQNTNWPAVPYSQ